MNQQQKVKQEQFRNWYQSTPKNEISRVREAIIHSCSISSVIFYNWLSGITPIPSSSQIIINQIAGKDVFEVPEIIKIN